ncbi:MAG: hypothetical protein ACE5HS_04880 [bacterium]
MRRRTYAKTSQRFVMYIPTNLREEIETWVNKMGITLAEFGREAFETYLSDKRKEERTEQLVETCKILDQHNDSVLKEWSSLEQESWPA